MNTQTNTSKDDTLYNEVARILGTAILRNDRNYTDDLMAIIKRETDKAVNSTHKIYEKELGMWKRTVEQLMLRENLKTEPTPIVITDAQLIQQLKEQPDA